MGTINSQVLLHRPTYKVRGREQISAVLQNVKKQTILHMGTPLGAQKQ